MAVADFDYWLDAQNCLVGAALIDAEMIPRIAAEIRPDDLSGTPRKVWEVILSLFREGGSPHDVDPVAILHRIGDTKQNRDALKNLMQAAPYLDSVGRYIDVVRTCAKLSRLRDLGQGLFASEDIVEATDIAGKIGEQLIDRPGLKLYGPEDLEASFQQRHREDVNWLTWPIRDITDNVPTRRGMLGVIGAEPSGGKTAFAIGCLLKFAEVARTLFVSLETSQDQLYDCLHANVSGISMSHLMRGTLDRGEFARSAESYKRLQKLQFRILPGSGMDVASIKAAALMYQAEVVIIDYLGLIHAPGNKSRYEQVTEISMQLHNMAQSTGMLVLALSQVTNRDPTQRNRPLDIHSARESGQIEADADFILMIDKLVDKELLDAGCKANRVLRCVKNKRGRIFKLPLFFRGEFQRFERAYIPNPDMDRIRNTRPKATPASAGMEQLGMDYAVPFEEGL